MIRRLGVSLVMVCAVGMQVSYAQCGDAFDGILCASLLSTDQVAQFDAADEKVSDFWHSLSGDYIELVPSDSDCYPGYCGFSDATDATVLVKVGATDEGLYVYSEVRDNTWVDPSGGDSYGDDSVDLYFDKLSADEIFTCTDCQIGLYSSTLTYTSQQFQLFMGGAEVPGTFRYSYYDDNLWTWTTADLAWNAASALYGFEAEIVAVDATTKAQEWFFPWTFFGKGLEAGTDLNGMKVGFAGGYNDMDGDNTQPDKLRWPNGKDPWASDARTVNYWGDILLPDVATAVRDGREALTGQPRSAVGGMVVKVDYFSLAGEKLSADAILGLRPRALVVRRTKYADGTTGSMTVRVTR